MNEPESRTSKGTAGASATTVFDAQDIEKNKVMSALAYIIFFLPLIACSDSPYGRFHANQGLLLLLVSVVGSIILTIIPVVGWILLPFFGIAVAVVAIIWLVGALQGRARELPAIGKFRIIK